MFVAGITHGSFAVPMRYTRKWAWENTWFVWSLVGLLIIPWLLAFATVPHLTAVYVQSGTRALVIAATFGALWGVAALLFGRSVELVGMSLTFAIVNGLSSAIGSWVPMLVLHPGKIVSRGGLLVSGGVLGVVAGVALCSWAGHLRSKATSHDDQSKSASARGRAFWTALVVTILSGLLAPCFNLGIAFGQRVSSTALEMGSSPAASTNAVLPVILTAGFLCNIAYCSYCLIQKNTLRLFAIPESKRYFFLGSLMGFLWFVSFAIYGSATSYFGVYGTIVGWPILMAIITIASVLWDLIFGVWKLHSLRFMALGTCLLILAVALISYGTSVLQIER